VLYSGGDGKVPRAYGVFELHEPRLAAPSVFVIDRAGQLFWRQLSRNYTDRADTDDILRQLEKLPK
jgi:peroxiredoxin